MPTVILKKRLFIEDGHTSLAPELLNYHKVDKDETIKQHKTTSSKIHQKNSPKVLSQGTCGPTCLSLSVGTAIDGCAVRFASASRCDVANGTGHDPC